jgi:hypothetical protein
MLQAHTRDIHTDLLLTVLLECLDAPIGDSWTGRYNKENQKRVRAGSRVS